jgi:glycosyltransferase involved in cell wall biosynthesis
MPFPWSEHYAYFMSPLKMFEYMAAGRPIVATDLPSAREILDDKSAVIVKPGDAEDLARGILKVLRDEEAAAFLAENARAKVKNYSWDERVKNILKFINKYGA